MRRSRRVHPSSHRPKPPKARKSQANGACNRMIRRADLPHQNEIRVIAHGKGLRTKSSSTKSARTCRSPLCSIPAPSERLRYRSRPGADPSPGWSSLRRSLIKAAIHGTVHHHSAARCQPCGTKLLFVILEAKTACSSFETPATALFCPSISRRPVSQA